jgi:undecaprenyl-diphosphatase
MSWLAVILLALVEGLTEFLPVSSTGHMILVSSLLGIENQPFVQHYQIIIQFGAILSVLVLYWEKFKSWNPLYIKILAAFLPTAIIGFLFKSSFEALLGSPLVVSFSLIVGGFIFLGMEKYFKESDLTRKMEDLSFRHCVYLGLFQCFALVPGVSRAGATIIGALLLKMNRKEAAEFSFFLAVPTLAAASLYKGVKALPQIDSSQILFLVVGSLISFFVAMLAIKFFVQWIARSGFVFFGWYRILLGFIFLFYLYWPQFSI